MSRHQFGSRGDHAIFVMAGVVIVVGMADGALVPGLDELLLRAVLALLVLVVGGWVGHHLLGEVRFSRELRRPPRPLPPGWRTCMVRVDPKTGAPWRAPVADNEDQAEPVGGA